MHVTVVQAEFARLGDEGRRYALEGLPFRLTRVEADTLASAINGIAWPAAPMRITRDEDEE